MLSPIAPHLSGAQPHPVRHASSTTYNPYRGITLSDVLVPSPVSEGLPSGYTSFQVFSQNLCSGERYNVLQPTNLAREEKKKNKLHRHRYRTIVLYLVRRSRTAPLVSSSQARRRVYGKG